ncbi:hypothetical protein SAMN04488557_3649 [Hyphomicrobium facile]|uniref:Uncharacterized protein n=1 Tax=Hyphomicrobium facile TaxID=51670 RepID=A0A1I7NUE2_9HYPH|nr:hypothetical protein SAMN04488557_3649 [Hyphomicrobium facile]
MRFDIYHPGADKVPMVGIPTAPYDQRDIGAGGAGKRGSEGKTEGKFAAWQRLVPQGLKLFIATRLRV